MIHYTTIQLKSILNNPNFQTDPGLWDDGRRILDMAEFLDTGSLLVFHYLNLLECRKLLCLEEPVDHWP